jgi:mannosyltransferase PIG-V
MMRWLSFNLRFVVVVALGWVGLVIVLLVMAHYTLVHTPLQGSLFERWDAGWYETIVNHGYDINPVHHQTNVVFFPLYPLLVRLVGFAIPAPAWTVGVGVSLASFVAALGLFYDFVARRYDELTARWATVLLAFNPLGLFFGLVYTESLFLLLSVAVFWLLERRAWWWAAVVAGLAGGTRVVGLALGFIVVARWCWEQRAAWRRPWMVGQAAALTAISLSGLGLFALYLQLHNHDALMFIHGQRYWGRTGPSHLLTELEDNYRQLCYNFGHYPVTGWLTRLNAFAVWYAAALAGAIGLWLLVRQREYWFAVYVALGIVLPLASGTVGSMDRYVMVLFPLYIAVARAWQGRARWIVAAVSVTLWAAFWLLYFGQRMFFG